jgi:hypothetical protein
MADEKPGAARRGGWLPKLLLAAAVGILYPYLELQWKCRASFETSEACVWGKSYFPLSRIVEPVIIAPIVFVILVVVHYFWRLRSRSDDGKASAKPGPQSRSL